MGSASRTSGACTPCRSLQLRRRIRQLGGWLVCWEKRVVLQGPWEGLPRPRSWMCACGHDQPTLRLQCGLRKLDGRVERTQKGLVLPQCRQGMPACCRWLRLRLERVNPEKSNEMEVVLVP